jgi:hypothetical protein
MQLMVGILVYLLVGNVGLLLYALLVAYDIKLSHKPKVKKRVIHHIHTS